MFNNGNAHDLNGGIIRQIGNGPIIIDIYTNGYKLHNRSRNDSILNVNPGQSISRISRGNYFLCVLDNEIIRPIQPNAGDVIDVLYVTNDALNGIHLFEASGQLQ